MALKIVNINDITWGRIICTALKLPELVMCNKNQLTCTLIYIIMSISPVTKLCCHAFVQVSLYNQMWLYIARSSTTLLIVARLRCLLVKSCCSGSSRDDPRTSQAGDIAVGLGLRHKEQSCLMGKQMTIGQWAYDKGYYDGKRP